MRVVPLDTVGLEKTSTAKGFLFFIFDLEYLLRVHSSEPIHGKMNSTSCLFGSRFACAQTVIFPPNCAPKMRERHQLFFGLRLVSKEFKHSAIQTKVEQIKVHQPIRRQDSMQTWIQTSRRLDSFLHLAARNFEVFSNIQ